MLDAPSLWDLIELRADADPGRELLVDSGGSRLTNGGFRDAALRTAAGLHALGVRPGTVVSWQLPTWTAGYVLMAALCRLGAVQNPIIPIYRDREVGFIVRQIAPELVITPSEFGGFDFAAMIARLTGGTSTRHVAADRTLPEGDPATLPAYRAPGERELRWYFYSSGTTADPKGARHTDTAILAAARGMHTCLALTADDINGMAFPLTHIAGPIWLGASLMAGASNVLLDRFDPGAAVELFGREKVTLGGSGTPFHLAYLKAQREFARTRPGERAFPTFRLCNGGGAPRPATLHAQIRDEVGGLGVIAGWGLTEAPILTMSTVHDPQTALDDSEGRPMPGVELRVVTLDGRTAKPGEEGELRARAPQLMLGYVDAALDGEAFDEEGYFRTGDLGTVDEDGFVRITGRLKDIIIRKGENISAKEIEDLLFTHPHVADVAVIGLPDPERGERVCAVVVGAEGAAPLQFLEMVEFLRREGLMTQKLPEQLELLDLLPRNPTGKVIKRDLVGRFKD
ncbi:cyclohexanecarboxylate-CoA ligase [Catenulispora yoronensis]|uniref:Cyclohexanecarboxylate-CoA ligase n=1 Tax=Catenulispora yoronensis TaxID=450799 RepID=A0ABN2TTW2_9ACTN